MSTSSNGFDVYAFGPVIWASLNFIALNYPVNPSAADKKAYETFFKALGPVLPCQLCSQHYKKNTASLDPDLHLVSRFTLIRWVFDVHNKVNASKRRPTKIFSTTDMLGVIKMFECMRAGSGYTPARGVVSFVPRESWTHSSSIVKDRRIRKEKVD